MRLHLLHAVLACALIALPSSSAAQERDSVTVDLERMGGSDISGTVVLWARGNETDFSITLTAADRAQQRREYDVWLRAGTCASPGRRVDDIEDVHPDGRPEHEDEDVVLADILRSDHILEVTVEDRDEVVACGEIPRSGS